MLCSSVKVKNYYNIVLSKKKKKRLTSIHSWFIIELFNFFATEPKSTNYLFSFDRQKA